MDLLRLAVEIARRNIPVLSLALVHVQLYRCAIAAVKGLIAIEQRLHVVITCGNILQAANGIAKRRIVDDISISRLPSVHVYAKDQLRACRIVDLHARLGGRIVRE